MLCWQIVWGSVEWGRVFQLRENMCEALSHLLCALPGCCQVRRWKFFPSRTMNISKTRGALVTCVYPASSSSRIRCMRGLMNIFGLRNLKGRCSVTRKGV